MNREIAKECLMNGGRKTSEEEIDRFMKSFERGVPVMPVEFFCGFLEEWGQLATVPVSEEPSEGYNEERWKFAQKIQDVFLQIRKSNLLARTIYGGEKPRTKMCPIHKGKWTGCSIPEETPCKGICMSDANVTGWLREE